jgi:hypothetical protein
VNQTWLSLNSRPVLQDTSEESPMRVPHVSLDRRIWRSVVSRRTLTLAVFLCLAACATHRGEPPQCKGPFTPINQSSSVVANGPPR